MYKFSFLIFIGILSSPSLIDAKRRISSQSHNLGDFCIPGTCIVPNSNCKRVGGTAFRCVCKEQYISTNKTHCVRVINASMDSTCAPCIERGGVCLDENFDDRMDKCFCQTDSDLCHGRTTTTTTSSSIPITQSIRKNPVGIPVGTPIVSNHPVKQGDLILGLYDLNQQRLVDNGGSVFVDDRVFIEIKYRTVEQNSDRHQIIAENCSIASSVSDNEIKLEKVPLLTNRCPSLDSRLSIRFQRIDPDHIKSTVFQIRKFDTTSIVYLRCSIAICYGKIENCQERLCPETRRSSSLHGFNSSLASTTDTAPFDYVDEEGASVIALRKRRKRNDNNEEKTKEKLAKLISDLTSSMDQSSSNNLFEDNTQNYYEIRQIQQQFTIESPLSQPVNKHKTAYEALYGRTGLSTQGAVERSTVIATIALIFIIGISISLFVVYRACYVDYSQRIYGSNSIAGFGNGESVYGQIRGTGQVCRYDMGRRSEQRFDESFFVTNVEPLGAYRRQY